MEYPFHIEYKVKKIFGEQEISISLYSGLTVFVGSNASGKTQSLKAIRDKYKNSLSTRYLSSNRIGNMEQYRSRTGRFTQSASDFSMGDQSLKQMRHELETASGDFFTLDEKKDIYIKVAERLSVLFGRQIFIRWDAGHMKVFFGETDTEDEYSVVAEASGLINIISILAALYDSDVKLLLIDEPEVSLHPQLQSFILREIRQIAKKYGKTVIISTHSTEMIPFDSIHDLKNIVFFSSDKKHPIQIGPDEDVLKNRKLQDFLMRMGQLYKTGFFAKNVLLIEGASDLIICRYLAQRLELNLDVSGTQVIPIDGKGQFPTITKFFRLIGKNVITLTDLDGLLDDDNIIKMYIELPESIGAANECGFGNLAEMVRSIKTTISKKCMEAEQALKNIYSKHPYWINRKQDEDLGKILNRAIIGQLFTLNYNDVEKWPQSQEWHSLKTRIETLLSILEKAGCFVLRKGAIESYYQFSSDTISSGKPSAAANETGNLDGISITDLEEKYGDIIRALEYSSVVKNVDESYAVKKELLSELALAIETLSHERDIKKIRSAIKQAKGGSKFLFDYQIIDDGKLGLEVDINSNIINVTGFPFRIYLDDNVNQIVNGKIHYT